MATQHEIVLIDGGDDVGATTDFPTAPPNSAPAVNPRVDGPRWKGDPGERSAPGGRPSSVDAASKVVDTINRVLIHSPLLNSAKDLAKAFSDIYTNVENIGRKGQGAPKSPDQSPAVQPAAPGKSSPAPDAGGGSLPAPKGKAKVTAPVVTPKELMPGGGGMPGPATKAGAPPIPVRPPPLPAPAASAVTGPAAAATASAAQGMTALTAGLTIAGGALAGLTVAAAAGAAGIKALFDTLGNEVRRLEGVSAEVNVATSMNEVRREMADLRRAEKIGPDLARFEALRGKMEDKMYDLGTEIHAILLKIFEALAPAIETVINGISVAVAALGQVNASIDSLAATMTLSNQDNIVAANANAIATARLATAMKRFVDGQQDQQAAMTSDPFLDGFLSQFAGGAI